MEKNKCGGYSISNDTSNFRRQGLMKQLMGKMIEEIDKKCECTLLFTETLNYIQRLDLKLCRNI